MVNRISKWKSLQLPTRKSKPPSPYTLSGTPIPFGLYKGKAFDEVPLSYLDWLSGQDWLYGTFRKRITAYILHPTIQRELEELFPDPDTKPDNFTPSYQRREPMPKDNPLPAFSVEPDANEPTQAERLALRTKQ